jgi:hypothetical protein
MHPLFLAYCERMTPARLAFVALHASALRLDFANLEQYPPHMELLARLSPQHLNPTLIRISLQILTVGLTDVFLSLLPQPLPPHCKRPAPRLPAAAAGTTTATPTPTTQKTLMYITTIDPPLRAAMRAFFCAAVLVFRRMIRHRPERISAWMRLLFHGPSLHSFLHDPSHRGNGPEALRALRGLMTFTGFTVYELLMRSDPAVVGIPVTLYGQSITTYTLWAEQVEWSTRPRGPTESAADATQANHGEEEHEQEEASASSLWFELGGCITTTTTTTTMGGGECGGNAESVRSDHHQSLLLAVDDHLRARPHDTHYAAYAQAHVPFYWHYHRLLMEACPPWCTTFQNVLPLGDAAPALAPDTWDTHLDAVIFRHFFTLLCHNSTALSAAAAVPASPPPNARLDVFGCASDAHLPMQLTLHAEFASSYYAMAPYVDALRLWARARSPAHHQ